MSYTIHYAQVQPEHSTWLFNHIDTNKDRLISTMEVQSYQMREGLSNKQLKKDLQKIFQYTPKLLSRFTRGMATLTAADDLSIAYVSGKLNFHFEHTSLANPLVLTTKIVYRPEPIIMIDRGSCFIAYAESIHFNPIAQPVTYTDHPSSEQKGTQLTFTTPGGTVKRIIIPNTVSTIVIEENSRTTTKRHIYKHNGHGSITKVNAETEDRRQTQPNPKGDDLNF